MGHHGDAGRLALCTCGAAHLTFREVQVLLLAAAGLSGGAIGRKLDISPRTVEDHLAVMRKHAGACNTAELVARCYAAEVLVPGWPPHWSGRSCLPETSPGTACRNARIGTISGTIGAITAAPAYDNSVRIGYARVSTRAQEHRAQLDALGAAHCREVIVETAGTRGDRPKLREALGKLQAGDTLVIYKPDRVARSMKELLVLLEDQLRARGINLHILTGICTGIHRLNGATIADKMLVIAAAVAAEMERDLIRERTVDGLRAAQAQGRRGGRPPAVDEDALAVARVWHSCGESVTAIARHLKIGRSTLYRALQPQEGDPAPAGVGRSAAPAQAYAPNGRRMTGLSRSVPSVIDDL